MSSSKKYLFSNENWSSSGVDNSRDLCCFALTRITTGPYLRLLMHTCDSVWPGRFLRSRYKLYSKINYILQTFGLFEQQLRNVSSHTDKLMNHQYQEWFCSNNYSNFQIVSIDVKTALIQHLCLLSQLVAKLSLI